ncbi:MAG: prolipoprotein diacylglyceryl transferase, partial [Anaerolineae bacterium]|nr:prolipoprotein diacylglyceryl transferase [Anaerolineae bacterium]
GLVSGLIYGQRKGLRLRPTLDALTPVLAVLAIALAMANAASGKAFGAASELPWAIQLWGAMRHPTQIYQLLAAGWIAWCVAPSRTENQQPEGTLFTKFVIYSAAAHLFLEAFRGDSILLPNGWRSTQVLAWSILAIGLWAYGRLQYPNHTEAAK